MKLGCIACINLILLCLSISSYGQKYQFSLQSIAQHDPIHLTWHKEENHAKGWIGCKSDTFAWNFVLPGKDEGFAWDKARFLILEVAHENPTTTLVHINFFSELYRSASPDVKFHAGVLPGLVTQIIFPLRCLSGESVYTPRHSRQLKGMVEGERMEPARIKKVMVSIGPVQWPDRLPKMTLHNVYLANELPEKLAPPKHALVDSLWQWSGKPWVGKARNRNSMTAQLHKAMPKEPWPISNTTTYLGSKKLRCDGTGYFRTHFDGSRWWLVDPEGYAFLSTGINHIRPSLSGPVEGMEDLFAWLPDPAKEGQGLYFNSRGLWHFNFLGHNLHSAFGIDWQKRWRLFAAHTLTSHGFNTIGNLSEPELCKESKLPYVWSLRNFPMGKAPLFRDFPDVFDPSYVDSLRSFSLQLFERKADPFLIGYFLGNEPDWASDNRNLAVEMLGNAQRSFTRSRLSKWLAAKYKGDIVKLNETWIERYASFTELDSGRIQNLGLKAQEDLALFSAIMVDSLITLVCKEMKRADPNHLNLGFRFTVIRPELCHRLESQFDVFSVNGNGRLAPEFTSDIRLRTGKPVLISEFMVGATDRGLLSSGIVAARNQEERGYAIQNYVEEGFSRPEVIGIHYFQLYDQPVLGRFDGENYGIGLFDVCNKMYPDPMMYYHKTNSRVYSIARGRRRPVEHKLTPVKPTWF